MEPPAQLHEIREENGSSSALSHLPPALPLEAHHDTRDVPSSPPLSHQPFAGDKVRRRARRGSSVSHVDVDFFDPAGVKELQRTLTRMSANNDQQRTSSTNSDTTLLPGDGPFDFEKTLRVLLKK